MAKAITVELIILADDDINTETMLEYISSYSDMAAEAFFIEHNQSFSVVEGDVIAERDIMDTD